MDQTTETPPSFPAFAQKLLDYCRIEGRLEGKRETLLRLMTRAGFTVTEKDRARVNTCADSEMLDYWLDNILSAKNALDQKSRFNETFPPFLQKLVDWGRLDGMLDTKRNTLLRLLTRAAIAYTPDHHERVTTCTDSDTLDRWTDNILSAKVISDVFD